MALNEQLLNIQDIRASYFPVRAPRNKDLKTEIRELTLQNRTWREISLEYACRPPTDHKVPFIRTFSALPNEEIPRIRKRFGLHPVIDNECSSSVFNIKDQLLTFENYVLLTISDLDTAKNLDMPLSLKLIYSESYILIFSPEPAYCINELSKDDKLVNAPLAELEEYHGFMSMAGVDRTTKKIKIDISDEQGCTDLEIFFHKMLEEIFNRLEGLILSFDEESKSCVEYATNLSVGDRIEFIQSLSLTEQRLIYLRNLLKPKRELLEDLRKNPLVGRHLKYYLDSMLSRVKSMHQRLQTSSYMLKTAEHIYEASVEETLTNYSNRLNTVMKHFSSIATIFLPLNLIAGLFGMNVKVPMAEYDSLWPFSVIVGICVCLFFFVILYFKNRDWL